MIRLISVAQGRALAHILPAVAVERLVAFVGTDGKYDPDKHGSIVVLEAGDDIEKDFPEFGPHGLASSPDDDWPAPYEYVFFTWENGIRIFEAAIPLAGEAMLVMIVPDEPWLDERLRGALSAVAVKEG